MASDNGDLAAPARLSPFLMRLSLLSLAHILQKLEHTPLFNAKAEVTLATHWWNGPQHKHTAASGQD